MAICICGAVPCEESAAGSELGRRLDQLALCCQGLELAVQDFCGGRDDETARRLARLAAGVAEQSERLAKAATERGPL